MFMLTSLVLAASVDVEESHTDASIEATQPEGKLRFYVTPAAQARYWGSDQDQTTAAYEIGAHYTIMGPRIGMEWGLSVGPSPRMPERTCANKNLWVLAADGMDRLPGATASPLAQGQSNCSPPNFTMNLDGGLRYQLEASGHKKPYLTAGPGASIWFTSISRDEAGQPKYWPGFPLPYPSVMVGVGITLDQERGEHTLQDHFTLDATLRYRQIFDVYAMNPGLSSLTLELGASF